MLVSGQSETLGARIRRLRGVLGINQSALAARISESCTQSRISSWEADRSQPDLHYVLPLANALGVSTDELLSGRASTPVRGDVVTSEQIKRVMDP